MCAGLKVSQDYLAPIFQLHYRFLVHPSCQSIRHFAGHAQYWFLLVVLVVASISSVQPLKLHLLNLLDNDLQTAKGWAAALAFLSTLIFFLSLIILCTEGTFTMFYCTGITRGFIYLNNPLLMVYYLNINVYYPFRNPILFLFCSRYIPINPMFLFKSHTIESRQGQHRKKHGERLKTGADGGRTIVFCTAVRSRRCAERIHLDFFKKYVQNNAALHIQTSIQNPKLFPKV